MPHGYIGYRLTGDSTMDYDAASMVGGMFDEEKLAWNEEAGPGIRSSGRYLSAVKAGKRCDRLCVPVCGRGDRTFRQYTGHCRSRGYLCLYAGGREPTMRDIL